MIDLRHIDVKQCDENEGWYAMNGAGELVAGPHPFEENAALRARTWRCDQDPEEHVETIVFRLEFCPCIALCGQCSNGNIARDVREWISNQ